MSPQARPEFPPLPTKNALNIRREVLHLGRSEARQAGLRTAYQAVMSTTTAKKHAPKPAAAKSTEEAKVRETKKKPSPAAALSSPTKEQKVEAIKARAAKANTSPVEPTASNLREALIEGVAVLVEVRANGTVRSLPYLPPGTDQRKQARPYPLAWGKGETVAVIAEDLSVGVATARRFLTNLSLPHDVEAGKFDKAWKPGEKQVVVHRVAKAKGVISVRVDIEQRGEGELSLGRAGGRHVEFSGLTKTDAVKERMRLWVGAA
jgi:hypothetical protein